MHGLAIVKVGKQKTTGCYRKDSLKLAARCPVSGCWPSCLFAYGNFSAAAGLFRMLR